MRRVSGNLRPDLGRIGRDSGNIRHDHVMTLFGHHGQLFERNHFRPRGIEWLHLCHARAPTVLHLSDPWESGIHSLCP
jgi:hypothetical protein